MNVRSILTRVLLPLLLVASHGQAAAQEQALLRLTVLPDQGTLAQAGSLHVTVLVENPTAEPVTVTRLDLLPMGLQPTMLPTVAPSAPLPTGTLFIVPPFSAVVREYTVRLTEEGGHTIAAHLSYTVGADTRLVAASAVVTVAAPPAPFLQSPIGLQLIGALLALLGGFGATLLSARIGGAAQRKQQAERAFSLLEAWLRAYQAKINAGADAPPDVYAEVVFKEGLFAALASGLTPERRQALGNTLSSLYVDLLQYARNPATYNDNAQLRSELQSKITSLLNELAEIGRERRFQ